jgi:YHS domain-containing protein
MVLRLLIGIIVIYLLYKLCRGWKALGGARGEKRPVLGEELVEDPFCHTYVPISHACKTVVGGKTLYFCSQACMEAYRVRDKK